MFNLLQAEGEEVQGDKRPFCLLTRCVCGKGEEMGI